MSRCFAYNRVCPMIPNKVDYKGPLIESIKLQKDKDKAKDERRKEGKREKKDKKRKLKELSKSSIVSTGLYEEKKLKLEEQFSSLKGKYIRTLVDEESSDVTEEHGLPVCYSSENSQNSDKRRRHESLANTIKADGNKLKIRISSFKNKEPSVSDCDVAGPSTSGRVDPIARNKFEFGQKPISPPVSTVRVDPIIRNDYGFGQRLVKEQPCSTSFGTSVCGTSLSCPIELDEPSVKLDIQKPKQEAAVPKPKSSSSKRSKVELLYDTLFESWAPDQASEGFDEDDWLFSKKSQNTEKMEITSNAPCSMASDLCPRAQFLQSVNIYALPYTVPF